MKFEIMHMPEYRWLTTDGKYNVVFDVTTSKLLQVDDLVLRLLKTVTDNESSDHIVERFAPEYDEKDIVDALQSISDHIKAGELGVAGCRPIPDGESSFEFIPSSLCLNISEECQLACVYCFAEGGSYGSMHTGSEKLMSQETAFAAIDLFGEHASRNGVMISLFGGEPLTNWCVFQEVVNYAKHKLVEQGIAHVMFSTTTNAIGITEERARFLKENNVQPMVSIDGTEVLHNELRPAKNSTINSFAETVRGLKIMLAQGLDVTVRATITSKTENLKEIFDYFRELGVARFNFQPIDCDNDDELALSQKDLSRFCYQLSEFVLGDDFIYVTSAYNYYIKLLSSLTTCRFCVAGSRHFGVASNGDVYPCHRFVGIEGFKRGNVNDPESVDIHSLSHFLENESVDNSNSGCQNCWLRYLCNGACYGENYSENSDISIINSRRCFLNREMFSMVIARLLMDSKRLDDQGDIGESDTITNTSGAKEE